MSFLKRLFGGGSAPLDGMALATSSEKADYAQIDLLEQFAAARPPHTPAERQRWSRVLPQPYDETLRLFERQGWLERTGDRYQATAAAAPILARYRARQEEEKQAVLPKVRDALRARQASEALEIRRAYEARLPLGKAEWTGPEPQLSHSALTRQILFLNHWLLDGLGPQTVDWLKLYAAEQHLWGASWRLPPDQVPDYVQQDLAAAGAGTDGVEAAYHKANALALYVENHETWQRCKGGDHVRRIAIEGPDDEFTCATCRAGRGKQHLVARVPELPHRGCTSPHGCRCRYEPVLESFDDSR
jgi:hypothetical protein